MPDLAISSASYASAETREGEGSVSSNCLYEQLLFTRV